ncbi:50S ribosomal protein L15-like [Hydractinia symbiolongicarpus]|uniref:50S ribosomal protein L15-like n=1 Tax=Hydractinia symbiolongicarpus TaxID=13093 RepID=UPI002550FDC6|nr:50S ribosomal protein L15-like [Hydractinia symbiolongicarpus]
MVLNEITKTVCHVERNLKYLKDMPRVGVNNIRDFKGAFKKKKRVGRGPGSGKGKTAGKGHKGQGQRGTLPRIGFEGGQTPFYRLVPKHGFTNKRFKKEYNPVHLNTIQYFIDSKRIDPDEKITMETLWKSGAVSGRIKDGVKLLGAGCTWFDGTINIEVSRASQNAIQAVERNGGRVKCVYHDRIALRALLKPEKYDIIPRPARPGNKHILFYSDPNNRGFLADPVEIEKKRNENLKLGRVTEQLSNVKLN